MHPNLNPPPSVHELARKAQDLFNRNIDTLVAGFLVRHPDVDPGAVELVMQTTPDGMRFGIAIKEVFVPAKAPQVSSPSDHEKSYGQGWDACRQNMIDLIMSNRHDAMVSTLSDKP